MDNYPEYTSKDLFRCPNCGISDFSPDNINNCCQYCNEKLCNNCMNEHYDLYPTHLTTETRKRYPKKDSHNKNLSEKLTPFNQCGYCGKNLGKDNSDILNRCSTCQVNLCNECGETHKEKNKDHSILRTRQLKNGKNDIFAIKNFNTRCKLCKERLPFVNQGIIYNCYECVGNLCYKCLNGHDKTNPNHQLIQIKTDLFNIQNEKYPKYKCNACGKYINDNVPNYYCDYCPKNVCEECSKNHNEINPDHDLILTKRIMLTTDYNP